jgi:murein L,D-transpeptidase YafK
MFAFLCAALVAVAAPTRPSGASANHRPNPKTHHGASIERGRAPSPGYPAAAGGVPRDVDSLVVEKTAHSLTLYAHGIPVRHYQVALGSNPVGDKERAGDGRTPEGVYHIDYRNPESKYHRSLHISYPDAAHRARSASGGVAPGGDIMIHGLPPRFASYGRDHLQWDWTNGCIALTDQEMDEVWAAVPNGVPIEIKP